MKRMWLVLITALVLVAAIAAPAEAVVDWTPVGDTYTYSQSGARITVFAICDDGTIVPGPHPAASINEHKSIVRVTAHGVEKLDAAMQTYTGHYLTEKAKAFLYDLLGRVTCPATG